MNLTPGVTYEVQVKKGNDLYCTDVTTRSDTFPIGKTTDLGDRSGVVTISEGGSPNGYHLVTGGTITGGRSGVIIDAPYVIVRGLTIRDPERHGIELRRNAHHVVIEGNDVSGWGGIRNDRGFGYNGDAAVYSGPQHSKHIHHITIQNNVLHDPRSDSNSWREFNPSMSGEGCDPNSGRDNPWCHPEGPQAITLMGHTGGNIVIRYNAIFSNYDHMYNDAIGSISGNFGPEGFPGPNSDIYGNFVSHFMDNGMELEGGGRNVRVWGNHIRGLQVPDTYRNSLGQPISSGIDAFGLSAVHIGPVYLFDNVLDRNERGGTAFKLQSYVKTETPPNWKHRRFGGGAVYVLHNTSVNWGTIFYGSGKDLTGVISRNNLFEGDTGIGWSQHVIDSSFQNDVHNMELSRQVRGIRGRASFRGDSYQLAPGSIGIDQAMRLPNINDCFNGSAPDVGAFELGDEQACAGQ
ncbi:hypothetical protein GVX82_04870 [Patescibacteria group bacterium]|jgi:hypothetical protein|nr:hypothetical protein [Patescibacteria group bacterium]